MCPARRSPFACPPARPQSHSKSCGSPVRSATVPSGGSQGRPLVMTPLVVRAHAKINLDLRIVGRRDDGYHDLRTIFQSLALHDQLVFQRRRGAFTIESADPDMPTDATNLVWRAAQALWSADGRAGPVRGLGVTIHKRIPSQAGLGGGSSDAAATLAALNRLWRVRLDAGDLARLAATLG